MGVNLSIIANSIENQNILYSRMYWEKNNIVFRMFENRDNKNFSLRAVLYYILKRIPDQ